MATSDERQRVHQAVLKNFIETGHAPHFTELAKTLGVSPNDARRLLHETIAESPFSFGWATPDTDYLGAWAPFSNLPTQHAVTVDGLQKWYGQ